MKTLVLTMLILSSFTVLASSNYPARDLKVAKVIEITQDIDFGDRQTGIFFQDGKITDLSELNTDEANCFLVTEFETYHEETRSADLVKKGEIYEVKEVEEDFYSRGRVHIVIKSKSGRSLYIDCSQPTLTLIKINHVKKSFGNFWNIHE